MANRRQVPGRMPALQAKHSDQDVEPYATKFSCATHQVTYYVPANQKGRERCPVCHLEIENDELLEEIAKMRNERAMLIMNNERMKVEVDISSALTSAVEMLGEDDLIWLKENLYQYKLDKSVVLKVTHGAPLGQRTRKRDAKAPNGFIAMRRKGDPEGHTCSSIGGLAIARYYEQATSTYGAQQAMELMIKALWQFLPGARP